MYNFEFIDIELEAAALGEETDYPDLLIKKDLHADLKLKGIDEKLYFGYGKVNNILPYKIRESYDRDRKIRTVKAAVLESDGLRAVFLTEYGCRLWSLYDKREKKELLFNNPVLQFADLAVRNAWFAGGVEWNIGFIGHSPLTCEKMFCEKVIDSETGVPVLRFYEYERIRRVVYEVDAYISEEHNMLMVRVRIKNPHEKEIPMYWWSNIAVPETVTSRVVVDANEAYTHAYDGGLAITSVPYAKNTDITYSAFQQNAADYFFRVPDDRQKFISLLDQNGEGLIQTSTKRLKGRKLFVWGISNGGRSWQDFLSHHAHPYTEIQAGLARTQTECLPMPAGEEWEWLEAYGFMKADSVAVHSYDYDEARADVRNRLISEEYLEKELKRTAKSIVGIKGEMLQHGSGWAFIEQLRRFQDGLSPLIDGLEFTDAPLNEETLPWFNLLKNGTFEVPENPQKCGYMIDKEYIERLEKAISDGHDNWFSHYQLGICLYANLRFEEAKKHFEISLSKSENPYAMSCLSHFEFESGNQDIAIKLILDAFKLDSCYGLAKRIMKMLFECERFEEIVSFYDELTDDLKSNGRMIYYYSSALLSLSKISEFEEILNKRFVIDDLKEAEVSLFDLWVKYNKILMDKKGEDYGDDIVTYVKQNYPTPKWMNFNMKV